MFEHYMRGHIPFLSACEICLRARSCKPAVRRSDTRENEVQLDQFFEGQSMRFLAVVHTKSFAIGCVCGEDDRETIVANIGHWLRYFGVVNKACRFCCDAEGYMRTLWEDVIKTCPGIRGTVEQFAAGRRAPVAERAVRSLREGFNACLIHMRDHGVGLRHHKSAYTFLYQHVCHAHSRRCLVAVSALTPLQRLNKDKSQAHRMYAFGSTVLASGSQADLRRMVGKFAYGAYLGPVLNKTSHWTTIQLDGPESQVKVVQSSAVKCIWPLRFDVQLLGGLGKYVGALQRRLPRLPPIERAEDDLTVLPLSATPEGNPPKEFFDKYGKTKRCGACDKGLTHGVRHSVGCRRRDQQWVAEQRDLHPAPALREQPAGSSEGVDDPLVDEGEVDLPDLPEVLVEPPVDVDVEGPGEPDTVVEGSGVPTIEDYLVVGTGGGSGVDSPNDDERIVVDPENMEVDMLLSYEGELLEALSCDIVEDFVENIHFRTSVFQSVEETGWVELRMKGRVIHLQRPSYVKDDSSGKLLDADMTTEGMIKELKALDSLKVGDPLTKSEADEYCREHKIRILSTRWVSVGKRDGETKRDVVRARVVARDYASGAPSAAELGISSPTSSNEAFRLFAVHVSSTGSDVVLAVSTAFLFALVVSPECVTLPSNVRFGDNSRVYLKLRKSLYGLRSASLAWYKHLSELVGKLGLVAADTEKSVFVGKYEFEGEFFWMLLLAYVDDLMVACKNTKAALDLINQLGESVKIKVTGVLSKDKKIDFLGRRIERDAETGGIMVSLPQSYFASTYESFQIKKGTNSPPDLRKSWMTGLTSLRCRKH